MLKETFEAKSGKEMGDWRKLGVEGIQDFFSSPNTTGDDQVKESEMGGTCSTNKR